MAFQINHDQAQMYDGERLRDLWQPGDGPGDGDTDLIARGHTSESGHPTWKIYASDGPNGVQRTGNSPPLRVYLDDKACYDLMVSNVFSRNLLGKYWPYDFTLAGLLRASRPNRGRPASREDGKTAAGYRPTGAYYFYGEQGKGGQKRKRATSDVTVAANRGVEDLDENTASGLTDGSRSARSRLAATDDNTNDPDDQGNDDVLQSSKITKSLKRKQTPKSSPPDTLEELDQAKFDQLRIDFEKLASQADDAQVQAARVHEQFIKSEHGRTAIAEERKQLQTKLKYTIDRLETKHRDNTELNLTVKRQQQDNAVTKYMLEKKEMELKKLVQTHASLKARLESDDEQSSRSKSKHDMVLELYHILYSGHVSSKAIIEDMKDKDESLPEELEPFDEIQTAIDEGIDQIKQSMESRGLDHVFRALTMDDGIAGQDDIESDVPEGNGAEEADIEGDGTEKYSSNGYDAEGGSTDGGSANSDY